ncbi:MAG: histidine--tRNA ligase family protein [Dehalococcoidales bacterium]|nr:histidine--tRNA ligase family protein [Dehalococcoidales bacterium]
MKVQRCKGFRDLLPIEMEKFRLVEAAFRDCCAGWGYQEIRTPTLEYLYLFTSTGTLTPRQLNKAYSFLDWDGWSGERVVLRPEGTIPAARFYIDTAKDSELAKYYYVANSFVFDETGKQSRERWQCGVELIGVSSPVADVELITMAIEVLRNLNLGDIELQLSHAGLIQALISSLGIDREKQTEITDRILDGEIEALTGIKTENKAVSRNISALINMQGKSGSLLRNLKSLYSRELPAVVKPLDDLINIVDLLESLGIKYKIDIDSGRGFEYYTGFVFHVTVKGERVGGGGRYDALIPLMSQQDIPASGFALYLDRLINMVEIKSDSSILPGVVIKVSEKDGESVKTGFKLAAIIHQHGGKAEMDIGAKHPVGFNWVADVTGTPVIVLTNHINRKKYKVNSASEMLEILENEKTSKNRSTKRSSSR